MYLSFNMSFILWLILLINFARSKVTPLNGTELVEQEAMLLPEILFNSTVYSSNENPTDHPVSLTQSIENINQVTENDASLALNTTPLEKLFLNTKRNVSISNTLTSDYSKVVINTTKNSTQVPEAQMQPILNITHTSSDFLQEEYDGFIENPTDHPVSLTHRIENINEVTENDASLASNTTPLENLFLNTKRNVSISNPLTSDYSKVVIDTTKNSTQVPEVQMQPISNITHTSSEFLQEEEEEYDGFIENPTSLSPSLTYNIENNSKVTADDGTLAKNTTVFLITKVNDFTTKSISETDYDEVVSSTQTDSQLIFSTNKEYDSESDEFTDVTEKTELPLDIDKPAKKISELILDVLQHFKNFDSFYIPSAKVPDPMTIPDISQSFSIGKMVFKNVELFGLRNFEVNHVNANITEMKVKAILLFRRLVVKGYYTLNSWFSKAEGLFSVELGNVTVVVITYLEVEESGYLAAQDMDMDSTYATIDMTFEGLGFLEGMMHSLGTYIFDTVKPFVLNIINMKMRKDINKEIRKFHRTFSDTIPPIDQLIYEIKKFVRSNGYDPYYLPSYSTTVGIVDVKLSHTWLYGLSSFERTKEIRVELRKRTVFLLMEVGTDKLTGVSNWEACLVPGTACRDGQVSFTVNRFRIQVDVSQNVNTSFPPLVNDIQLELGKIQIMFNGLGDMDYIIQLGINIIPNLLKYQILSAIERPIKLKIQETLNTVNLENFIKSNADLLDNGGDLKYLQLT